MAGNRAPEVQRFGLARVIGRVLEHPRLQISDRMPVDDHMHPEIRAPVDRLVEQLEVFAGSAGAPGRRVNGNANEVRPARLDRRKELAVPVGPLDQIVGIGNRYSAEDHGRAGGIDEVIALHRNAGKECRLRAERRRLLEMLVPDRRFSGRRGRGVSAARRRYEPEPETAEKNSVFHGV